jgi:hypothetical protein
MLFIVCGVIVVLALVAKAIVSTVDASRDGYTGANRTHICRNCGETVAPKRVDPGSPILTLFLWLFFIVPGIFYSLWRSSNRRIECPACGAANPVSLTSPAGRTLTAKG